MSEQILFALFLLDRSALFISDDSGNLSCVCIECKKSIESDLQENDRKA